MAYSDTLSSQRDAISNMKGNIDDVSRELASASEKVQNAANSIASCFFINDIGADNKKIAQLAEAIRNIQKGFNNNVVTSINAEVSNLNNQIRRQRAIEEQERKEKEERERKERERRENK